MNGLFGAPASPPADTFLHRLDARLKLAAIPLLIAATFAAHDVGRLALLGLFLLLLQRLAKKPWSLLIAKIHSLRWLLLATLLLHLFFTPGRTLFGLAWLSHDGLIGGITITLQLSLALLFTTLITSSSDPETLTVAAGHLGAPLQRLGIPVHKGVQLSRDVLQLLPLLRQESLSAYRNWSRNKTSTAKSWSQRSQQAGEELAGLLLKLADNVDIAAKKDLNTSSEKVKSAPLLPTLFPPDRATLLALMGLAILFYCYTRIPAWNA
ncbi:MAG: hypothetical protein C0621_02480 [Desulfuromonas sp.]|nr:MAG: hypothetical protein C0621_02480 [Desulfuromonas sp.]